MSDNNPEDFQILPPLISEEDVDQEQVLLRLEYQQDSTKGSKNPKKDFIRKRLKTALGSQGLYGDMPSDAQVISNHLPQASPETIQKILEWAFDQGEKAENIVLEFLAEPTDRALKLCLKKLVAKEFIPEIEPIEKEPLPSLSSILLRQLQRRRRMSIDELYALAEREHVSARPRAAVRQTLRRWNGKGLIKREGNDIIWNQDE